MKVVLVGVVLIVLTPFAAIGMFFTAITSSMSVDQACSIPESSCYVATPTTTPALRSTPAAYKGSDGMVDDPTTSGRITARLLHLYQSVQQEFGGWPWGVTCWDAHTWNPTSDHPRGRACDFAVGHIGRRPTAAQAAQGQQLARWAQLNAGSLGISYVIWQGHIWSVTRASDGWRPYSGASIYDPASITGGHYDHVHVSVSR